MAKRTKPKSKTAANPAPVHFKFFHPTAQRVCIAGTFNDWDCAASPMVSLGEGRWAKELLLPPGTYEYRLVVDDEWVSDPQANETVANPFGSHNVLLRVPPPAGAKSPGPSRE